MALPNFLIVGAQKSGTTSLHDILKQHPQVNMSEIKETNFFTIDRKYERGLEYYQLFFQSPSVEHKVTGESSPGYMCTEGVAERIRKDLGEIKIVMVLRDPIKRAFSQYWDNRRHLSEFMTEEMIVERFLTDHYKPGTRGYFSRGVYLKYVKKYQELFGPKNVYVMLLENLIKNQTAELHALYRFLDIEEKLGLQQLPTAANTSTVWGNPLYQFCFRHPTITKYIPRRLRRILFWGPVKKYAYSLPKGDIGEILISFYRPWNNELSKHLNINLSNWIK